MVAATAGMAEATAMAAAVAMAAAAAAGLCMSFKTVLVVRSGGRLIHYIQLCKTLTLRKNTEKGSPLYFSAVNRQPASVAANPSSRESALIREMRQ